MSSRKANDELVRALDKSIEGCRISAKTLEQSLRELLVKPDPISEVKLCEVWLHKMRQHKAIYADGWYMPPPHGMFVQFATDADPERVNKVNNRPPESWPQDNIFLDRENGLISAYASPVERATGLIGDFSISLYFGDNPDVQAFHKKVLDMDIALFKELSPGMEYADIAQNCADYMVNHGMYNIVASPSDPAGTNIGHTVPASDVGWTTEEREVFVEGVWEDVCRLISSKRVFLNVHEHSHIPLTSAHSIEPRPMVIDRPDLPMINFHTWVVWKNGHKELITFFGELFRLAGMDYMFDEVTSSILGE